MDSWVYYSQDMGNDFMESWRFCFVCFSFKKGEKGQKKVSFWEFATVGG